MKTPKYIKKLAADINTSTWLSNEAVEEQLIDLKKGLLRGKYYTRVDSVDRSGMSRTISIATLNNGSINHVTNTDILALASISKSGRISGCGMDMLFAAQYSLFQYLCPNHRYQDAMTRYNDL